MNYNYPPKQPCILRISFLIHCALCIITALPLHAENHRTTPLVFVEYNCENLFDCRHDSLKQDYEFLPDGERQWTFGRYWKKLNDIARVIQQCGDTEEHYHLPDLVALCEVENDSTLISLTRRSLLRGADYKYIMTSSPDRRGIDVALLYNPLSIHIFKHRTIRISPPAGSRPTRDILYVKAAPRTDDTLHIFVLHAPSRSGGELETEPYRLQVADRLLQTIDSIRTTDNNAAIMIAGDFNDYSSNNSLRLICNHNMAEPSQDAVGLNFKTTGVRGTYKYQGQWDSLDHILLSPTLQRYVTRCFVLDNLWLLSEDTTNGGYKPRRTYGGTWYQGGVSDHLPLVLKLEISD